MTWMVTISYSRCETLRILEMTSCRTSALLRRYHKPHLYKFCVQSFKFYCGYDKEISITNSQSRCCTMKRKHNASLPPRISSEARQSATRRCKSRRIAIVPGRPTRTIPESSPFCCGFELPVVDVCLCISKNQKRNII